MLIHYINLDRDPERRAAFLRDNAGCATLERFPAVEGKALSEAQLMAEGIVAEPLQLFNARSYGSAMSHRTLWQQCVAAGEPMTVCEDDAVLSRRFAARAEVLLATLPDDWDIVRWGWNFDSLLHYWLLPGLKPALIVADSAPLGDQLEAFRDAAYPSSLFRLRHAFGLACYSVSPKGARALLDACFPLRNLTLKVPMIPNTILTSCIDVTMNCFHDDLEAYVCCPPLVWSENAKAAGDPTVARQ